MAHFELVLTDKDGTQQRFPVGPSGLTIGRTPEADVHLETPHVSRRHARVWVEDGQLMVEDLASRNGVGVDRRRVGRASLDVGQELCIGDTRLRVVLAAGQTRSSIITPEIAGRLHDEIIAEKSPELLLVLYRSARLLGTVFDLDELFERILEMLFEAVPAERGCVVTRSPAGGAVVRAQLHASGAHPDFALSQTLLRQVFENREAVLTQDAQKDSRFEGAESVIGYAVHGAMCAPMLGHGGVVGALYVDSADRRGCFQETDLEVLAVIGQIVGVAVENGRLHQQSLEQERLAAIGEATAGIGHCMKNLLMGITGAGEFIEKALDQRDWTWLEKGWGVMSRAIQRHEELVMNLLAFSRRYEPQYEKADLNALVREAVDLMESTAARREVRLRFEPGEVGENWVDTKGILRVLMNLLGNAVEACEAGQEVCVETAPEGPSSLVRVRDTGVGIPAEVLPKLGRAFFTTKGSQGTGLGLANSLKIVREHGGDLSIESREGEGTVCTVRVPAGGS